MGASEVAVVVSAFDAAGTLRRAVDSVRAAAEVTVVFDGPDVEGQREVADLPIRIRRLAATGGAPACRNAGLTASQAPFVLFLDADDHIEGPLLEGARRAAAEADLVLAPFALEYHDGSRQLCDPRLRYRAADPEGLLRAWLSELNTPPCAVLWRREFLLSIGGWDESIAGNGDLIYRALARRPRVAFSTVGLGVYVQREGRRRIDARALASQLRVLDRVRVLAAERYFEAEAELARAYYGLARLAFAHGADDLGAQAEAAARALGLADDPGPVAHRALTKIFGLRGKQRLAKFARSAAGFGLGLKERMWPNPHSSASIGARPASAPISPTPKAARSTPSREARERLG